jgi:hypothetical protein
VFEVSFANEQALASFIGRYTLFATSIAILIQFLLASRMIAKIGLSGTHMLYNIMLVFGFLSQFMVPGVGSAVFARFVETELRFAIRNPVNQLMTNLFSRDLRIVSRAITIGAVNPIAALMASFALMFVGDDPMHPWRITFYILTVGLYLWASMLLYRAIRRHRNDP